MKSWITGSVIAVVAFVSACSGETATPPPPEQGDTETRIIEYLADNVRPGQVVVVSELFNDVFSSAEEQAALDQLFNTFFKIPMFLVQFESSAGQPPTLEEISEQFNFTIPGQADVMLRVMESDPRIPEFFQRDAATGEITSLDVEPIRNHPQFGQAIERSLAGWVGRELPSFAMETFAGGEISSADVAGRPYMMYVWFSNCPPCVQTSPLLVGLHEQYSESGFEIVAANADRVLQLPYDDQVRSDYVEELGIQFVTSHITEDIQNSFGGVSVFPTMFFVNSEGVIVRHFMNFQEESVLEEAIQAIL